MGFRDSIIIRLLLGLLPFDIYATAEFLSEIRQLSAERSWRRLLLIFANIGLLLTFLNLIGLGVLFYIEGQFPSLPIPNIGLGYGAGIGIVIVLILLRYFVEIVRNIEEGSSPFDSPESSGSEILTSGAELIVGILLLSALILLVFETTFRLIDLVLLITLGGFILGVVVACFSLISSGLFGLMNFRETTSVDELEEGRE